MKVLMITGDANMMRDNTNAHERLKLQATQVEKLTAVFWGRGSLFAPFKIREHFDVVTTQDPFWRGVIGWVMARRLKAKLNVQIHADLQAQSLFKRILAEFVMRRADSIRVVSERIKKQLQTMNVRGPVTVLPVFVDIERFSNVMRVPHEEKVILWIGRFESEKDPLRALSVLREIRAANIDAHLIMLGAGSMVQEIKKEAEGLSVEFPGWRDPREYLAKADVVLCTSHRESWGASIIEALAAGVPVVALDVGIAKEAGAVIAPHGELAKTSIQVLRSGVRGALKVSLLSKQEWGRRWRETLI